MAFDGKDAPPADFDWVTARHQCSPHQVFHALMERARQNVATINTLREREEKKPDAFVQATVPGVFSVVRGQVGAGPPHAVRFSVDHRGIISVEAQGVALEAFSGSLTLDDQGQCRLKVGTEPLDEWQVLRRALEPLFFDLKEWEV